ncbi:helix-turn-helix transcriptional regulator [Undibacterium sp.]|jgi:transcriptional regulator with XRE-family HTH domain|uniref:helix-turn-helix domain-containing protein n=1 Tax=Undibacterium sp. TaxID=1914977 RepID=UPI002BC0300D|nr:helix-turn-helix transcriptional regulator [Undibacterium sp.]HTD02673.1 helix-turn-helix transcriptional regulator [Undibacterium sp.]
MAKTKTTGATLSVIVGKNIQACRKRKGLTQNQLAQALEVEVETVSRYERGTVAPSFPQLENICAVLDVTANVLFSDGYDAPNAQDFVIGELLKGLSTRDRDFIRSYVQQYAEHHQTKKKQ